MTLAQFVPAILTKAFGSSPITAATTTTLAFTITNGTGNPVQSNLGFTDTLPGAGGMCFPAHPPTPAAATR